MKNQAVTKKQSNKSFNSKNGIKKSNLQPNEKRFSKAKFRKDTEKENNKENLKTEVKVQKPIENRQDYYRNLSAKNVKNLDMVLGKVVSVRSVILTAPTEPYSKRYSVLPKGQCVMLHLSEGSAFHEVVAADGRIGKVCNGNWREMSFA